MSRVNENLQVVETGDPSTPVALTRITPGRTIRAVFWGLRVYIGLMMALVIVGFLRGVH